MPIEITKKEIKLLNLGVVYIIIPNGTISILLPKLITYKMKKMASKVWRKIINGYGCINWFCGAGGLS